MPNNTTYFLVALHNGTGSLHEAKSDAVAASINVVLVKNEGEIFRQKVTIHAFKHTTVPAYGESVSSCESSSQNTANDSPLAKWKKQQLTIFLIRDFDMQWLANNLPFVDIREWSTTILGRIFVLDVLKDALKVAHSTSSHGIVHVNLLLDHVDHGAHPMHLTNVDGDEDLS